MGGAHGFRQESGCPWTSEERQTRALLWVEPTSPVWPQVAGTAKLQLDSMQLPLTAKPEQAQESVLGSCILDTGVPLLLTLHRDEKGEQPGLPGGDGSWALPGLRNQHLSFLRVKQLLCPKMSLGLLDRGGHKTRPMSPLLCPHFRM